MTKYVFLFSLQVSNTNFYCMKTTRNKKMNWFASGDQVFFGIVEKKKLVKYIVAQDAIGLHVIPFYTDSFLISRPALIHKRVEKTRTREESRVTRHRVQVYFVSKVLIIVMKCVWRRAVIGIPFIEE